MQKQKSVELEGNPTTGYSWICAMSREGVIRELSSEYVAHRAARGIVGSGGKFVFSFKAVAPGDVELVFSYLRAWEKETPALKTVVYKATVDSRKNLKLIPE